MPRRGAVTQFQLISRGVFLSIRAFLSAGQGEEGPLRDGQKLHLLTVLEKLFVIYTAIIYKLQTIFETIFEVRQYLNLGTGSNAISNWTRISQTAYVHRRSIVRVPSGIMKFSTVWARRSPASRSRHEGPRLDLTERHVLTCMTAPPRTG